MFEENGFGQNGPDAAGSCEPNKDGHAMNEKDDEIAHPEC
jgi:hypothetical protein